MDVTSLNNRSAHAPSAAPEASGPLESAVEPRVEGLAGKVQDIHRRRQQLEDHFVQCTRSFSALTNEILALVPALAQAYGARPDQVDALQPPSTLEQAPLPPAAAIIVGAVSLADEGGAPLVNREVIVSGRMLRLGPDGKVLFVPGQRKEYTDRSGHAAFQLVRGLEITVAVAGTDVRRDLVVPTNPEITEFNLLDPLLGDDGFAVQHPPLDYAVRRTL